MMNKKDDSIVGYASAERDMCILTSPTEDRVKQLETRMQQLEVVAKEAQTLVAMFQQWGSAESFNQANMVQIALAAFTEEK